MMHVSPFISFEPVLFKVTESTISKEYDSEETLHRCEDERSSSPSIEFEPLPASLKYVALDHDRDSTMISQDDSLEMENLWATEFCEAPTLESEGKDSIDEHGSFILVMPQEPCSINTSPELGTFCAPSTYEDYNHLKVLSWKIFRRLVIDAFVYHKYCKLCGCTVAIILQLKLHDTVTIGGERGTASPMIAAGGSSHGRAWEQKQSTAGRHPGLSFPFQIKARSCLLDKLYFRYFWSLTISSGDQKQRWTSDS
jgi:hypothetical protein